MKVPINNTTPDFDTLKQNLLENFPSYSFFERSKNYLVAKKNKIIGANIIADKKNIYVIGNIPSRLGNFLLIFIVLLLGIIIPIILYFIFIHFKMRRFEKEIASFISNYK